jgi:hypothetical protein
MKMKGTLTYGLNAQDFEGLSERTKRKLLVLMSRISEASYRRGCQQAQEMECAHDRIGGWRYGNLDKSPGFDTRHIKFTALERLDIEYGPQLYEVGLHVPACVAAKAPVRRYDGISFFTCRKCGRATALAKDDVWGKIFRCVHCCAVLMDCRDVPPPGERGKQA